MSNKIKCDHEMKHTTVGALGTNFNVSWCRHCGAFRVKDSKWELPQEDYVNRLEQEVKYYKEKAEA